jgi:hypothetical protein
MSSCESPKINTREEIRKKTDREQQEANLKRCRELMYLFNNEAVRNNSEIVIDQKHYKFNDAIATCLADNARKSGYAMIKDTLRYEEELNCPDYDGVTEADCYKYTTVYRRMVFK